MSDGRNKEPSITCLGRKSLCIKDLGRCHLNSLYKCRIYGKGKTKFSFLHHCCFNLLSADMMKNSYGHKCLHCMFKKSNATQ